MSPIRISVVSGDYDRVRAIKTGEVAVDGCEVDYLNLAPPETFQRLFDGQEFDVAEMSFSTYLMTRFRDDFPYTAVPVFPSRVFPHSSIYVRTDRGIETPEDLRGRLVGIPNYHFTRGLVVRGMLQDEYGVRNEDIRWRIGGIDTPGGLTYMTIDAPDGVEAAPIGADETLGDLLAEGRIDAIVTYRDPQVFTDRVPNIGRLFPDFRPVEQAYFRKSGMFPIMHTLGVRNSLIEEHPWITGALVKAFEQAKAVCMPQLVDLDALHVALPWLVAEAEATIELMGEDYWPYGMEKNAKVVETQARWSFEQGISPRQLTVDELFAPVTI